VNSHNDAERVGGLLIVAGSTVQLIAAALPVWRVFTSSETRVQLEAIASRPAAWKAQAVGFPVAFTVTGLGFAAVAATMPERRARRLAMASSVLGLLSVLLWLPITAKRLDIGRRADALLVEQPKAIDIGGWSFWPYTLATLGSILLMGCALIVGRLHRRLGVFAAGVSGLALSLLRIFRDWPPFASYVITLVIGLGIAKQKRSRATEL
jgi:hypothetical protein